MVSMGTVGRVNAVVVIQKELGSDSCGNICLLLVGFQGSPTVVMTTDNDCKAPSHDAVRRVKYILERKITLTYFQKPGVGAEGNEEFQVRMN